LTEPVSSVVEGELRLTWSLPPSLAQFVTTMGDPEKVTVDVFDTSKDPKGARDHTFSHWAREVM